MMNKISIPFTITDIDQFYLITIVLPTYDFPKLYLCRELFNITDITSLSFLGGSLIYISSSIRNLRKLSYVEVNNSYRMMHLMYLYINYFPPNIKLWLPKSIVNNDILTKMKIINERSLLNLACLVKRLS